MGGGYSFGNPHGAVDSLGDPPVMRIYPRPTGHCSSPLNKTGGAEHIIWPNPGQWAKQIID